MRPQRKALVGRIEQASATACSPHPPPQASLTSILHPRPGLVEHRWCGCRAISGSGSSAVNDLGRRGCLISRAAGELGATSPDTPAYVSIRARPRPEWMCAGIAGARGRSRAIGDQP